MLAVAIIVFREVLEAALIVGLLAAATRELAGRWRWLLAGIVGGVGGAVVVAALASRIAAAASGMGQELFNSVVLIAAVLMLGWHTVWMSRHGREMSADARRIGAEVAGGSRRRWVLGAVVGLAVLREGAELVLFLFGIVSGGDTTRLSIASGGGLGLLAGAATGMLLYAGLVSIPMRHIFRVTNALLILLAAGLAAQAASLLAQAGYLPELRTTLWNSSALLGERGVAGQVLHTLVGYRERPSGIEVLVYVLTAATLVLLTRRVARQDRRSSIPQAAAVAGTAALGLGAVLMLQSPRASAEFKVYSPYVVQGETELEARGRFVNDDDAGVDGDKTLVYEVGYSPTAMWHTSVFLEQEQEHEDEEDSDLQLEAFAWENILQLTEPGQYWADLGLYLEYEKSLTDADAHKLEGKLLVQKDIGRWVVTVNPIFAKGVGDVDDHRVEFEYAWATRYRLNQAFEPGFEAFGEIGPLEDIEATEDQEHLIGPDVRGMFRVGPGKLLYNVGYLFALTEGTPDGAMKFELEYEFRF